MEHIENNNEFQGLKVNKGIATQPSVNPYMIDFKHFRRKEYTIQEYVNGILKGDIAKGIYLH